LGLSRARHSESGLASYLPVMKFGFFDWLGRVIMLVLAGMITLSIIGAIAAIPSGSIETRMGMEQRATWPEPDYQEPRPVPATPRQPPPPPAEARAPSGPSSISVPAPLAPEPADVERWLESITYVLLALAGIAAFGTILFWRALGHWRRSADALEEIASRSRP
jgi:hypothetical protein